MLVGNHNFIVVSLVSTLTNLSFLLFKTANMASFKPLGKDRSFGKLKIFYAIIMFSVIALICRKFFTSLTQGYGEFFLKRLV